MYPPNTTLLALAHPFIVRYPCQLVDQPLPQPSFGRSPNYTFPFMLVEVPVLDAARRFNLLHTYRTSADIARPSPIIMPGRTAQGLFERHFQEFCLVESRTLACFPFCLTLRLMRQVTRVVPLDQTSALPARVSRTW